MERLIYTANDFHPQTANLLVAVRKSGSVEVQTPTGETFVVQLKESSIPKPGFPDFEARDRHLRELGHRRFSASASAWVDRIIAGEV